MRARRKTRQPTSREFRPDWADWTASPGGSIGSTLRVDQLPQMDSTKIGRRKRDILGRVHTRSRATKRCPRKTSRMTLHRLREGTMKERLAGVLKADPANTPHFLARQGKLSCSPVRIYWGDLPRRSPAVDGPGRDGRRDAEQFRGCSDIFALARPKTNLPERLSQGRSREK